MDADTVSAVNTHEKILEHFKNDNVPVLVGTQMVAKGLNMPNVTLVGVLDGDLSLYSGSYRAAETTFNMLTQVVGRAGRGEDPGTAMIQTLEPEHQVQNLPPFGDLVTVTFTGQEETQVLRGAAKFRDSLVQCMKAPPYYQEGAIVLGPAPCQVPKINYNYRYQLTLRGRLTKPLRELLAHLLREFSKDGANRGANAFADVNGYD